jgi:hypothetical protein
MAKRRSNSAGQPERPVKVSPLFLSLLSLLFSCDKEKGKKKQRGVEVSE